MSEPEYTLADHLFAGFGGGPDREKAYSSGALAGARTQEALARARRAQQEYMAREALGERGIDWTNPGSDVLGNIVLGGVGSDFSSAMLGRNYQQQHGFRSTIADPNTSMDARQYAGHALQGGTQNYLSSMGSGQYADVRQPDLGVLLSPLGDANVTAIEALANRRDIPPNPPRPVPVLGPDGNPVLMDPGSAVGMPPAPTRGPGAPVRAIGPDGNPVFVTPEEALGMQPAPTSTPRTPVDEGVLALAREIAKEGYDVNQTVGMLQALQRQMEQQQGGGQPTPAPGELGNEVPEGVPEGSTLVGYTKNGEEVWQGPDGVKRAVSRD
jgi:hypothetical protein